MPSISRHHFSLSRRSAPSSSLLTSNSSGEYWQLSDDEPTTTTTTQTIHTRRKHRRASQSKRSFTNIINLLSENKNSFPEVERLSFFPPYQSHTPRKSWSEVARSYIDRFAAKLRPSASSPTPVIDTDITFNFQYTLMASSRTIGPLPASNWKSLQANLFSRFKR